MGSLIVKGGNLKEVSVNSSKSYVHRSLICCCLCKSITTIHNVNLNNDVIQTINVLRKLNVKVKVEENKIIVDSRDINFKNKKFEVIESGSTLRFIIPLITHYTQGLVEFNMDEQLYNRPNDVYYKLFSKHNIKYCLDENLKVEGSFEDNYYEIEGDVSSQFISGLLFLFSTFNNEVKIKIKNTISSRDYIDMTIEVLKEFNKDICFTNNIITIYNKKKFKSPVNYTVEGDFSSAAFFICHSLLNKNKLVINNLNKNSIQADQKIIQILEDNLSFKDNLVVEYKSSKPVIADLDSCPDLGPILFMSSLKLAGESIFHNISRLRIKETDRVQSMIEIMDKLGVKYKYKDDYLVINGDVNLIKDDKIEFYAPKDHRYVMSLIIFALSYENQTIIHNYEAINKSFPGFIDELLKQDLITII